jgi:hypothetical protein
MIVDRHAKDFAVVDRRRASIEGGARDARFDLDWCAPDLPSGFDVEGKGPLAVDHVHYAVVDGRLRQLALVIHEARAPDWHEPLHVGFIDLLQRAVAFSIVAHALGEDIFGVLAVVDEFVRRLRNPRCRPENE